MNTIALIASGFFSFILLVIVVVVSVYAASLKKKLTEQARLLSEMQSSTNAALREISTVCDKAVRGHLTIRASVTDNAFKDAILGVNEVISTLHCCFENIRHPMQVLDKDINVLHFNKTVESYGYDPKEFMGKQLHEIYDRNLQNKYVEAYKIINSTRESYVMRTETPTAQGLIIEENCIWPIFSNGEIVAYGNITLDITDGIRFREASEKVMNYQNAETAEIIEKLQSGLGRGILRFTYKPSPHDEDTATAAGAFSQINETLNHSLEFIKSYIDEVNTVLSAIASGDLTVSITREYLGEFATIKASINNISTSLHKAMSEVVESSENVLIGAGQISVSAMNLADGATSQAESIQGLNHSIEMINRQTMDNVSNTNEAITLSDKSSQNAQDGNEVMKQMLDAMHKIRESSGNISRIIGVIQDIAFQTNLLALNASVEAARAGEHGKGFAVVADEVRSLAARSQTAATDTTGLIKESIDSVDIGSEKSQST
ncbi:MAG: methyl-accepting chemotaxis protein, partial [Defluviitaleaceae bacterium]|nr:methyl-accepting chemotaxis protein [Defluviitaleaceae bacterium]